MTTFTRHPSTLGALTSVRLSAISDFARLRPELLLGESAQLGDVRLQKSKPY